MNKLFRITTVPISLDKLIDGQMSFMREYYEVVAISSDEEKLQKVGKKDGVRTYCVEMTRKITPLQDMKSVWQLYRFFKTEKPYIVHTHTPKAGTAGMIAAWLARVPHRLHTVAGLPLLETTGSKRKLLDLVEKMTYRFANHIYPNSFGLRDIIVEQKLCPSRKLKVIGNGSSNGIDITYFDPSLFTSVQKSDFRKELGIKDTDFVFVFVGRLVGDKGINELVQAFNAISRDNTKAKLLLVGPLESDLDALLEETLRVIDTNSSIISIGFQKDVRPYLFLSDALVFPSYREGFPNVVMQAGAMGLPSIVTDINGCNEIIQEGVNGTIIPAKNREKLEESMRLLLSNHELVASLASNARELIASRYQREVVWQAILDEYKQVEKNHV